MKSVVIKSLEMTNYRQFVDQKIDFSVGKDKNIIIIEGKNGFGKSNIFNAITWCFFGMEEHLRPDDRALPICNSKLFKNLKPESSSKTSVKVTLATSEGAKELERTVTTYKAKDGRPLTYDKPALKISECLGKNWKISPYPEYIISRILPRNMRHFFFIDGEKLRQLFENINPEEVRKSIFDLSQITLLQNAIKHLDYVKSSFRSTIRGKEPEVDYIEDELQKLKREIEEDKKHVEKLKSDRNEANVNKKKLDQQLEGIDVKNISVLEEKRKTLEKQISDLEININEKKQEYFDYLFKIAPSILLKEPIDTTVAIISKLKEADKLPPKIEATFIDELLKKGQCICGTDLNEKENVQKRDKLKALLDDNAKYSNLTEQTIILRYSLSAMLKELNDYDRINSEYNSKIKSLEEEYKEKQKNLTEIKTKIGSIDSDKIKRIHETREHLINMTHECSSKIGRAEENIRFNEKNYGEIEKMYNRELRKKDRFKDVRERIAVCDVAINNLGTVKEKIMDDVRKEIQNGTKQYFRNLITAKNFGDFEIDSDYKLFMEQDGYNAITSLSAGETLCLGYSFMSALRQGSKFLAPIIIDTPLAKIDREYRINVADWFKKSLHDAQVILLVTNTEYTEEFRNTTKSFISKEYTLDYDVKNEVTEVKEYGK